MVIQVVRERREKGRVEKGQGRSRGSYGSVWAEEPKLQGEFSHSARSGMKTEMEINKSPRVARYSRSQ